jgi:hypothetical protein
MEQLVERRIVGPCADALSIGIEQKACREGADDVGQADLLGDEGQREAESEAYHQHRLGVTRPPGQANDRTRQEVTEHHGRPQEQHGSKYDPPDR